MTLPRLYDIKEAARYLGVASSTLRYWESEGLVQAGRGEANGYRQYSLHDLIEASEIAFYRKLGVPVKELRGYRALSARSLDEALARTEDGVEQRIAELEATKARLARQRALNAKAEELRRAGMQPGSPAIGSLSAIDYDAAAPWKLLVEEPWRCGVVVFADKPDEVYESAVDAGAQDGAVLWRRSSAHDETTCRECLLKVSPTADASNAAALFAEASRQGIEPQAVVGNYLRRHRTKQDAGTAIAPGWWGKRRAIPQTTGKPGRHPACGRKKAPSERRGLRRLRPRKKLADHREDVLLGLHAHGLVLHLAVFEHHESGHAHDAVLLRDVGALVDVELVDGCLAGRLGGNLVERGREHLARTAPRGEEVHENGTLRIKHLGLEIGRRNDLAHVKASFVGAARISHPRQFLFASYCKRVCSTVHQIVTVRSMNLDIPDIFAR